MTTGSNRDSETAASSRQERAPKLHHLLSKVGGVWWVAREQAEAELDSLLAERDRYQAALELIASGEYADAAENVAEDVLSHA